MEYSIIISEDAENDTREAYLFYEQEQPGLGENFLEILAEHYDKLRFHPTHYSFVSAEKTIRSLSLKVFPYQIIFEINHNEIYVYAIHHFRKRPTTF